MEKETYLLRLDPKKKATLQKRAAKLGMSLAAYLDKLTEFELEIEIRLKKHLAESKETNGQEKNQKVS